PPRSTDPNKIQDHLSTQNSKALDKLTRAGASETLKQRTAQRLHGRKDSFYHLHANIARKDAEKKALVSRIRAEKLEKSRNMQAEAQALGLDEYDRWRQQLEYNDDDFSRAFVE
ncbi:hypothetical protein TeGR_g1066, partial [Tetraparma gracilis]